MMEIYSLGQKIKKLRKEKNMTLKELAGSRITAAQISHIERDKSFPSQDLLEYFAEKLGVTIDYLLESREFQAKKISNNLLLKSEILYKSNRFEEAKREIDKTVRLCDTYGLFEDCAKVKYLEGLINFKEKNMRTAIQKLEQAFLLYIRSSDFEGAAKCCIKMGKMYLEEDLKEAALDKLHQGEDILKEYGVKSPSLEREIQVALAYAYMKNSNPDKSNVYAIKAEETLKIQGYKEDKGKVLFVMGNNAMEKSNYDDALEYFQKALSIYEEHHKSREKAEVEAMMGRVYRYIDDEEKALNHFEKAYSIKKNYEDIQFLKVALEFADELIDVNNIVGAKSKIKEALSMSIKLKEKPYEYKALRLYSKVLELEGKSEEAVDNMKKSLEMAKTLGIGKEIVETCFELARQYKGVSQEEETKYYLQGIKYYKELDWK